MSKHESICYFEKTGTVVDGVGLMWEVTTTINRTTPDAVCFETILHTDPLV